MEMTLKLNVENVVGMEHWKKFDLLARGVHETPFN